MATDWRALYSISSRTLPCHFFFTSSRRNTRSKRDWSSDVCSSDLNGIVHVSATDKGTGTEQSMTITGGSALPKEDIERMVREAEEHAEEDKRRREAADVRNN